MILLLGGTSESLEVADWLTEQQLEFELSVISDYGASLARKHATRVVEQVLTETNFPQYLKDHRITKIIDATHPFARVVSTLAMTVAQQHDLSYLRFERTSDTAQEANVVMVDSLAEACEHVRDLPGTIYLSTGSKTVPEYVQQLGLERIHVRVLPVARVLTALETDGLSATQIDGLRGPFTTELNVALFSRVSAAAVISKESGRQGGIQEKIQACQKLNIPMVIIRRPRLDYPKVVQSVAELAEAMEEKK